MRIIKNLIIKNRLQKELRDVENTLQESGYYQKERELDMLTYLPDDYAVLYTEIHDEFGELLSKKNDISHQLNSFSGTNLFKQHNEEYTR